MKRFIVTAIMILVCYLLQTTLFHDIELAGVVPNLVLIMTVFTGYIDGRTPGIAAGMACGFIIDCQYSALIGVNSLLFMVVGYCNGLCNQLYYREDYTMPIVLVALSELFYGIVSYTLEFLLRGRLSFAYYFGNIIMPELMYSLLIAIFLYKIMLKFYSIADKSDEGVEIE